MALPTRREFVHAALAAAAAAMGRTMELVAAPYDLLVKGGRVLDASQKLDRMMDVAIAGGRIARLDPEIAASDAAEVIDGRGKNLGTLRVGAPADVALIELGQGHFEFVDNLNVKRIGSRKLVTSAVIAAGKRVA